MERVYKGDTALIEVYLYDEDGVTPLNATSVSWQIKKPDGTTITGGPQVIDGAEAVIATSDTSSPGLYQLQATFTLANGNLKSDVKTFEVLDPLEQSSNATTTKEKIIDHAWMKLEDLFDSELGGPWLTDKTFASFNRKKIERFLPDALYIINNLYTPVTTYDDANWPEAHIPLAAQALLVESIDHLIRSYTEQPLVAGADISYFDRRDYQARWQSVLQREEAKLMSRLDLFKTGHMGFGGTAILVGGYGTPWTAMSKNWRLRHPRYVGPWAG